MAELTDRAIDEALARGRALRAAEPRAVAARYEAGSGRVVVDLANGSSFAFPAALVEGLADGTAGDLAEIELLGDGYGLHWERLDVDFTVPGLVSGLFGTARWLAARAGRSRSPAKAKAARANGAKGGRPRKATPVYAARSEGTRAVVKDPPSVFQAPRGQGTETELTRSRHPPTKETGMGDDLSNRGPQDRSRVNVNEPWELRYWTQHFGVSEQQLRNAVSQVGVSRDAVERHLRAA
ncbi:MAG: hypothetical protein QOJ94_355 [Sphingomonadales bacterium]|jgi:hypothetical protein|nr:hypothetical protein [Sphingomonadales bacterium]